MRRTVRPLRAFDARLRVPGDKSIAHRALLLAGVAKGVSQLRGMPGGEAVEATRRAMQALGVVIRDEDGVMRVEGRGFEALRRPSGRLDAGNSGTTMRLLAGLLAGRPFPTEIVGDAWLSRRPMERVAAPLRLMGARVETLGADGRPPLRIHGAALRGIDYELPVASAQLKSAVLLAGLQAVGATSVVEPVPSRDHTERLLRAMGAAVTCDSTHTLLKPGASLRPLMMRLPGDLSSAAPWLCAAALHPGWRVVVDDVGNNPGRSGFLDVLGRFGARVRRDALSEEAGEPRATLTVEGGELRATEIEAEEVPRLIDELALVAVLATRATGTTRVRGAAELRVKESDRIDGIGAIVRALGGRFAASPDGFTVVGPTPLRGATVDAQGDHRLAIAAAVAALVAEGETQVNGAEAVLVSYPGFWEDLDRVSITG
jgi:3-phosphoshikimate 1-carboxyvinyltransferase